MIEGPIIGRKTITLEKLDEYITRINVIWDIHFKGFITIFTIFLKKTHSERNCRRNYPNSQQYSRRKMIFKY